MNAQKQAQIVGQYLLCEWTDPYESILWRIDGQLDGVTYVGEYAHSEHEDDAERDLTFAAGERVIFITAAMANRMTLFSTIDAATEAMTARIKAVRGGSGGDRKAGK